MNHPQYTGLFSKPSDQNQHPRSLQQQQQQQQQQQLQRADNTARAGLAAAQAAANLQQANLRGFIHPHNQSAAFVAAAAAAAQTAAAAYQQQKMQVSYQAGMYQARRAAPVRVSLLRDIGIAGERDKDYSTIIPGSLPGLGGLIKFVLFLIHFQIQLPY